MASTPPEYPHPWQAELRADGWWVVALGAANRRAFGPFTEPTAKLIAAAHRLVGALRDVLAATNPTAKARARRAAEAALTQAGA